MVKVFVLTVILSILVVNVSCNMGQRSFTNPTDLSCETWQRDVGAVESDLLQFPHESNCYHFYECQYGKFTLKDCRNTDLHYNPYKRQCDYNDTPCVTFYDYVNDQKKFKGFFAYGKSKGTVYGG